MFNVLPQGATNAISSAVQSVDNAASNLRVGPLIRTGGPQPAERPTPTTATLPSGTPMGGFDIYPTRPQMPPTAPTPFPYGSALGPSIYTQAPTQTNLRTGVYSPVPLGQSFAGINPTEKPNYIPYAGGGTATMDLGGANVNYTSRLGLMGGNVFGGRVGPLPLEQITPMVAGQRPIIESGPVAMTTTGTQTPEQRGRQAIQTPYGTVYATADQANNMMTPRTMAQQSSRTPEQQQDLLAQMREAGAGITKRLAEEEAVRQKESIQRGYAFRQGLAETAAQDALDERFFKPDVNRGAQLSVEAERWKQAQAGRNPMSNEPFNVRGMQFRGAGMGQFAPVEDLGKEWQRTIVGGPQSASRASIRSGVTGFSTEFGNFNPFNEWNMNPFATPRS
jgi:hypothetical protein